MSKILVTWVARTNDPYERKRDRSVAMDNQNNPILGPTLTLLCDQGSGYCNKIDQVVLFYRKLAGYEEDWKNVEKLDEIISSRSNRTLIKKCKWDGDDPTDHKAIYDFAIEQLRKIRDENPKSELIINISPGTPQMQTVWFLIAENGLIEHPYTLVKTLRRNECKDGHLVVKTSLGIKLEKTIMEFKRSKPITAATEHLTGQFDPREFKSQVLIDLYAKAGRYAALKIPVLILGERGTGKSYLANWIRTKSGFRKEELDNGWPAVACGQYSKSDSTQLQAELFGSVVGAYTDAKKEREGLLKKAHNDTLFLDEIGDISQNTQRLLIKALEEKKFYPLGSDFPEESDFRLIAATNKPLDILVKHVDPDFFDRICQLVLTMPPLREIREDIPYIWKKIFEESIKLSNAIIHQDVLDEVPHEEIITHFQQQKWSLPGNFRDLQRIANNIIIYLHNPDASIDFNKILTEAFSLLLSSNQTQTMSLAKAYVSGTPLDSFLTTCNISTETIFCDLRFFLAKELRRMAEIKRVPIDTLCDVNPRTISNWLNHSGK